MQTRLLMVSVLTLATFVGCSGKTADTGSASSSGPMVAFVKTQDGSPLEIKAELFDTPTAKEFSTSGKNKYICLLYTSPSPRDRTRSRMPSSA